MLQKYSLSPKPDEAARTETIKYAEIKDLCKSAAEEETAVTSETAVVSDWTEPTDSKGLKLYISFRHALMIIACYLLYSSIDS